MFLESLIICEFNSASEDEKNFFNTQREVTHMKRNLTFSVRNTSFVFNLIQRNFKAVHSVHFISLYSIYFT
jgi:hypothetical protein